ncbi:penicillin-insensitive murein endopeptidase [Microbulbifer agarilyticus]|uniref:penicillin-insensitive murein endopeptidase n=1 Tax=Microbulbifer agarilyticus TaxID=260552 RepID=UPI001CD46E8C|nr:penicillin-insensitive murein endopeptidase [Microbulbifer agarilyticus]MCA0892799.1 penicillin-insensitive murein endopeptidase [Microbulbifer agarilyticus]
MPLTKSLFTRLLIAALPLSLLFTATGASAQNPWEDVKTPSKQSPESIGAYTNGCLSGAEQMPLRGDGFQLVRTGRDRHYGNPYLVKFLKDFSSSVEKNNLGRLQIGDMSMARGGPFSSGHTSHQMGLDADIWFSQDHRAAERPLSPWERDNIAAIPMADAKKHVLLEKNWDERIPGIVRLASEDPRVARIFVHPTIKRKMCDIAGSDNEWLRKVRPWWGHNYHFHVRLNCPPGDNSCKPQAKVKGDPCGGGLDWWFSDEFYAILNRPPSKEPEKPAEKPPMPAQCAQVLSAPAGESKR